MYVYCTPICMHAGCTMAGSQTSSGMEVTGEGSHAVARGSAFRDNRTAGVTASCGGGVELSGCSVEGNSQGGVVARNVGSRVLLLGDHTGMDGAVVAEDRGEVVTLGGKGG